MKQLKPFIFFLFLSLFLNFFFSLFFISIVSAISITPASQHIVFVPNGNITLGFSISDVAKAGTYITGDFSEYATLIDTDPEGQARDVSVILTFPKSYKPGTQRMLFGAKELPKHTSSPVGGLASVQAPIFIQVPYQSIYLDAKLITPNINENEEEAVQLQYENLGIQNITVSAQGELINAEQNAVVKTFSFDSVSLTSLQTKDLFIYIDMKNKSSGVYKVNAILSYEGEVKKISQEFTVGSLLIGINNRTSKLPFGKVSSYTFDIRSFWNKEIFGIYGEVSLLRSGEIIQVVKTPTESLPPWETKTMKVFIDTTGLLEDNYTVQVKVMYQGKESKRIFPVSLVKEELEKNEEIKKNESSIFTVDPTYLFMILLILLLIFFNYYIYKRRRKQ